MNRIALFLGLIAILLGASVALYIKTNFEWVEEEVAQGASLEARTNQLLAARRYLERQDVYFEDIETNDFFYDLPPITDTILLRRLQRDLSGGAYSNLLEWVDEGGHLVFGLPYASRSSFLNELTSRGNEGGIDEFLDAIGIYPNYSYQEDPEYKELSLEVHGAKTRMVISGAVESQHFDVTEDTSPTVWAENDERYTYAQLPYGLGMVSVLARPSIWSNGSIGKNDNALLLSQTIAANQDDYATVYIADKHTELPGVFTLLFNSLPWLCLLLTALALAMLRRASVRFGPVLTSVKPQTNNFARYLYGKTQFHERTQPAACLLASLRMRIKAKYGTNGDSELTEQELLSRISSSSKLSKKEIYTALFEERSGARGSFVNNIQILQILSRAKNKRAK